MKTIKEICAELTGIEMGLMKGTVGFRGEPSAAAPKPGHPVDVLDDLLNPIIYEIRHGKTPESGTVATTLGKLKGFREAYGVEDLDQLQQDIATYENNIGFFANSKTAESMIKLMHERIDAAKAELKELEGKIREIEAKETENE